MCTLENFWSGFKGGFLSYLLSMKGLLISPAQANGFPLPVCDFDFSSVRVSDDWLFSKAVFSLRTTFGSSSYNDGDCAWTFFLYTGVSH